MMGVGESLRSCRQLILPIIVIALLRAIDCVARVAN